MIVTIADMDLFAAVMARRYWRFLTKEQLRVLPNRGHFDPAASIHRAINWRAGKTRVNLDLSNACALLYLVRKNISTGAEKEARGLFDYMQARAYGRQCDARRALHYQRFLRRGLQAWRYTS